MKYFFILCLYLMASVESKLKAPTPPPTSPPTPPPDTFTFGSVREYPLYLHRCMATFVSPKYLLTTAECVLCADQCQLQVRAFSNHLSGNFPQAQQNNLTAESFNVTKIYYHPDYPVFPDTHNIAIIEIDGSGPESVIYNYANLTSEKFGIKGHMYSWQFSKDMKDYYLHKKDGETVSNTACSFSMNKYVSFSYICVMGNEFLSMGPFDQGSPFITNYLSKPTVAGIYDDSGFIHKMKFVTYQSLAPFYPWIYDIVKGPITTTEKPTTKVTKTTTHKKTTKHHTKKPTTKHHTKHTTKHHTKHTTKHHTKPTTKHHTKPTTKHHTKHTTKHLPKPTTKHHKKSTTKLHPKPTTKTPGHHKTTKLVEETTTVGKGNKGLRADENPENAAKPTPFRERLRAFQKFMADDYVE